MVEDPNPAHWGGRHGPYTETEVILLEGQLKEGHVREFTVMCDEGARPGPSGGTNTAPGPLSYFTLGIGF